MRVGTFLVSSRKFPKKCESGYVPPYFLYFEIIFAGTAKKAKLDETGIDRIKEMAKNSVGSRGQCFTCGKVLNSRANAIRHFMLVHSKDQISSSHPCPKCGKVFSTPNSVKDHLRRTHKIYASDK